MPLAALLSASPLHVPPRKPPIPEVVSASCDYAWAKKRYLEAYAYAWENPRFAERALAGANAELSGCREDVALLKARIRRLEKALFPAINKLHYPLP